MFRTKPLLLLMIEGMIAVSVVAEMVKVMLVGNVQWQQLSECEECSAWS